MAGKRQRRRILSEDLILPVGGVVREQDREGVFRDVSPGLPNVAIPLAAIPVAPVARPHYVKRFLPHPERNSRVLQERKTRLLNKAQSGDDFGFFPQGYSNGRNRRNRDCQGWPICLRGR